MKRPTWDTIWRALIGFIALGALVVIIVKMISGSIGTYNMTTTIDSISGGKEGQWIFLDGTRFLNKAETGLQIGPLYRFTISKEGLTMRWIIDWELIEEVE